MKVSIKEKSEPTITGEMFGGESLGELVAEMVTDPAKLVDFGFDNTVVVRAASLRDAMSDAAPEYPIIRVEEGWSGSKRLWTRRELDSIVEQTNRLEPVGNLGHIKDDDISTAFGDPQTTWIGAIGKDEKSEQKERLGEMVRVVYFAGYNHPGAKVRDYIKTRTVRGISWWGTAEQVPIPGKGVEVRGFTLKALDWARKLSEGMPTSRIVSIASEMEDKVELDLSQVTPEQLEREAPNLYTLVVNKATAAQNVTIGEMEATALTLTKDKDTLAEIRKILRLGEGDDVLTAIANAMSKLGEKAKELLSTALTSVLKERIPGDDDASQTKRDLVLRLLPTGEMETKLADVKPEDAAKTIGEMVDTAFNTDAQIKGIVGEMAPASVRRREDLHGHSSDIDGALASYGMKRERVTMG